MTDFGRRAGDMLMAVYDTDRGGVVDNSFKLDLRTLPEVRDHDPKAHGHTESQIIDLVHTPLPHGIGGLKHIASLLALVNSKITDATLDDKDDPRTPKAHKTSHQDGGADEIDVTGLVGTGGYVDRGDPTGWDKILSDFTTDGDWHDLILSALVPAGAISIHVQVYVEYGLQGIFFHLRKKGNVNALNRMGQKIQSMGFGQEATGFVSCDVNRTIEYRASAVSFSDISLLVKGWLI